MNVTVLGFSASKWEFYNSTPSEESIAYEEINKLIEGSFAKIYLVRASNDASNNWVLKIPKSVGFDANEREARILKVLNAQEKLEGRTYVIQLVAFFRISSTPVMLFPHYRSDLFEFHLRHKLSLQQVLGIAKQLLETAFFFKRQNLIHRDIKTENILVEEIGKTLKVIPIDFGSALWKSEIPESYLVGTALCLSPELTSWSQHQRTLIPPYDFPSDLWAIGCSLSELVDDSDLFVVEKDLPRQEKCRIMAEKHKHLVENAHYIEDWLSRIPGMNDHPLLKNILIGTLRTDPNTRLSAEAGVALFEAPAESAS